MKFVRRLITIFLLSIPSLLLRRWSRHILRWRASRWHTHWWSTKAWRHSYTWHRHSWWESTTHPRWLPNRHPLRRWPHKPWWRATISWRTHWWSPLSGRRTLSRRHIHLLLRHHLVLLVLLLKLDKELRIEFNLIVDVLLSSAVLLSAKRR